MKLKFSLILLIASSMIFAQKKKNGTIFIEHPAIEVINDLMKAMNNNDTLSLSKIISDDFKGVVGEQINKDAEPQTKAEFIQYVKNLHTNSRYFSIRNTKNSYPDAVEYTDENFSDGAWVYSWEYWTAVGATTGIDYSQPRHTQYVVKNNQVVFSRVYFNQIPYTETWSSQQMVDDGKIYSHHPNINVVRRFIEAFEHDDDENLWVDFAENVQVDGLFSDWDDDPMTLTDLKSGMKEFKSKYTIKSMDNMWIKYFEFDQQRDNVQSWWRLEVIRKSDQKEIVIPVMFNHAFNQEGKIVRHFEAWNQSKI